MRPGTPGFIGARLTEAREARGITITALSELVPVSRQSITQYENNDQTPGPEVLQRLGSVLAVPAHYFLKPVTRIEESTAFFRSMSAATKSARKRANVYLRRLHEVADHIDEIVELPSVDLPALDIPEDPLKIEFDDIERIAMRVREAWKLGDGPISNIIWLMENHGIVVSRMSLDATTLDGISQWINGRPYALLTSDVSAARSRFDAAHELGHIILHRAVTQKQLNASDFFAHIERQAHRFAAAFAFPATSFAREAKPLTLDRFVDLKNRWRVSIKMMIYRARDLRLISADQCTLMNRGYSYRRWHGHEPLDDELQPESSRLLDKSIEMILENGASTPDALAHGIGLDEPEILRIAGIKRARLELRPAPVLDMLKFRLRSQEAQSANEQKPDVGPSEDSGGVVVKFPPRLR